MKYIALIPLIFVSACVQPQDDMMFPYDDEYVFFSEEEVIVPEQEENELMLSEYTFEEIDTPTDAVPLMQPHSNQVTSGAQSINVSTQQVQQKASVQTSYEQPVQQVVAAQPTMQVPYTQLFQQSRQSIVLQPTPAVLPASQPEVHHQYMARTMPDGNIVIEMPSQQIYLPNESFQQRYVTPVQNANVPISASQPLENTVTVPVRKPEIVPILLQHPEQNDVQVQCQSNDVSCIASFEQQGFIQVRYLPQFSAYRDMQADTDYPATGRWRHQNNIPRW